MKDTTKEAYLSVKRLTEIHAKHFAIAAKAQGVPADKAISQTADLSMRILNDEQVKLLVDSLNQALEKIQEALDNRITEISYDVAHGIPVRFPTDKNN